MSAATAGEVMSRDVRTVAESATVLELIGLVRGQAASGVPIVDADGHPVGLVSRNDLARELARVSGEGTAGRHEPEVFIDQALAAERASLPGLEELLHRTPVQAPPAALSGTRCPAAGSCSSPTARSDRRGGCR